MSANLNPSVSYNIISLVGDRPTGFRPWPKVPPEYVVRVGEPVNKWKIERVGTAGVYRFTDLGGYPSTGVGKSDEVIVAVLYNPPIDRDWLVTRAPAQDGFTIELADKPGYGWTVSPEESSNPEITIQPIRATTSIPPLYPLNQLFQFVEVEDE